MRGLIELEDEAGDPCAFLVDNIIGIGIDEDGNAKVMLGLDEYFNIKTPYKEALKRLKEAL